MKVFLHTRSFGDINWQNQFKYFDQIPAIGEYIKIEETIKTLYSVQMVIHNQFDEADCVAEVFAVAVDDLEARTQAFPDMKD